jgi:hypothetical protein
MKRTTLLLALSALGALAFAGTAEAHFLTHKQARNAAFNLVKRDCQRVPTCEGYAAGPSTRVSAHKVRVLTHFWGQNAQTGPYDCHRTYTILIKSGSNQRFYTEGPRRCRPNTEHF